jgi:hypothetical protein
MTTFTTAYVHLKLLSDAQKQEWVIPCLVRDISLDELLSLATTWSRDSFGCHSIDRQIQDTLEAI